MLSRMFRWQVEGELKGWGGRRKGTDKRYRSRGEHQHREFEGGGEGGAVAHEHCCDTFRTAQQHIC